MLSYTQALGAELRGTGVTAAALCPGPVRTEFNEVTGFVDADLEAALPKAMWVAADVVAKTAVDGLAAGKTVIVPGVLNKVGGVAYQHLPRKLLLPILSRMHPAMKKR